MGTSVFVKHSSQLLAHTQIYVFLLGTLFLQYFLCLQITRRLHHRFDRTPTALKSLQYNTFYLPNNPRTSMRSIKRHLSTKVTEKNSVNLLYLLLCLLPLNQHMESLNWFFSLSGERGELHSPTVQYSCREPGPFTAGTAGRKQQRQPPESGGTHSQVRVQPHPVTAVLAGHTAMETHVLLWVGHAQVWYQPSVPTLARK